MSAILTSTPGAGSRFRVELPLAHFFLQHVGEERTSQPHRPEKRLGGSFALKPGFLVLGEAENVAELVHRAGPAAGVEGAHNVGRGEPFALQQLADEAVVSAKLDKVLAQGAKAAERQIDVRASRD